MVASSLVADTDTTTEGALEGLTMNPLVLTTVAGDLTTKWRRIRGGDHRPASGGGHASAHAYRFRAGFPLDANLFRRIRVLVAHDHVLVARDHVEVQSQIYGIPRTTK